MASQSYLVKCVFLSSVRHTGRAWAAGCTAAAGAETENTAQAGLHAALTAVCCPGRPAAHRTVPAPPVPARICRAAHPAALPPTLDPTPSSHPYPALCTSSPSRDCRNETGEIRRLAQGEKVKDPTINMNTSIYNLLSNIHEKLPLPFL